MVKSSDESEFTGDEFGPDGGYVPRILFFDDAGQHMKDIVQREDKYKASDFLLIKTTQNQHGP